jgi:hypothetical protein
MPLRPQALGMALVDGHGIPVAVRMAEGLVVRYVWPTLACPRLRELYRRKIPGDYKPYHQQSDGSTAKPLIGLDFHRLWLSKEVAPMADCWWE